MQKKDNMGPVSNADGRISPALDQKSNSRNDRAPLTSPTNMFSQQLRLKGKAGKHPLQTIAASMIAPLTSVPALSERSVGLRESQDPVRGQTSTDQNHT